MTATGLDRDRDASVALAWVPEKRQVFAWRKVPLSDSAVVMAARCIRAPWSGMKHRATELQTVLPFTPQSGGAPWLRRPSHPGCM